MKRSPASRAWGRRVGRARPVWGPRAKRPPPARPDRQPRRKRYVRGGGKMNRRLVWAITQPGQICDAVIFRRASLHRRLDRRHRGVKESATPSHARCTRFCSPSASQSAAREIRRGRGTRPARTPAGSARSFARLAGGKRTRASPRRVAFRATEASLSRASGDENDRQRWGTRRPRRRCSSRLSRRSTSCSGTRRCAW